MRSKQSEQQAWNAYWEQHKTSNSFGCDYTENEGPYGVVNRHWLECFDTFDSSETVCDLGAGNGALAKLFIDSRKQLNCKKWFSTDLALTRLDFTHQKVEARRMNAEQMELIDQSIDVFVSMFGIEYADLDKVFAEINRCLSPTGRYQFLLHHQDSVITQQSRVTVNVGQRILDNAFWQTLSNLNIHSFTELKHLLLQQLNIQMQQASVDEQDDVKIIGHSIFSLVQSSQSTHQVIIGLTELVEQIKQQNSRLIAQIIAADQTEQLTQLLEKSSLSCYKLSILTYNKAILGWSVIGKK